jgi:hypothetical protein
VTCAAGHVCTGTTCDGTCAANELACGGVCAQCPTGGTACDGTTCVCAYPLTNCGGTCTDTRYDTANCGACGRFCQVSCSTNCQVLCRGTSGCDCFCQP